MLIHRLTGALPLTPPNKVNLEFFLGNQIEIVVACTDDAGVALEAQPAVLRIASADGLVGDTPETTDAQGNATFILTEAAPAVGAGLFFYEAIAFDVDGNAYTQQFGTVNFRPSLFEDFPFTPPSQQGSGNTDGAEDGNLSFAH